MRQDEEQFREAVTQLKIDDAPREQHRRELREKVLAAFERASEKPIRAEVFAPRFEHWRKIMRTRIARVAAAGVFVLGVGAVITVLTLGDGASVAFADVLTRIREAQTVTYKMTVQIEGASANTWDEAIIAPGRTRSVGPHASVKITDRSQGTTLLLFPALRKAAYLEYGGRTRNGQRSFLDDLRQLGEDSGKPIGREEIDGRTTDVFRVEQDSQLTTIWADVQTGLPIRVEIDTGEREVVGEQLSRAHWVFSNFVWNAELDESLFSLEAPEGYSIERKQLDHSRADEGDLIEALRIWTEVTKGSFPDELSMSLWDNELMPKLGVIYKQDSSSSVQLSPRRTIWVGTSRTLSGLPPEKLKQAMQKRERVHRGVRFANLLARLGDWRYVGAGVKLGDIAKPVCWYKPEGADKYRVIYGDLRIEDVAEEPARPKH